MQPGFGPRETPDAPDEWITGQDRDDGERANAAKTKHAANPGVRGVLEATRRT